MLVFPSSIKVGCKLESLVWSWSNKYQLNEIQLCWSSNHLSCGSIIAYSVLWPLFISDSTIVRPILVGSSFNFPAILLAITSVYSDWRMSVLQSIHEQLMLVFRYVTSAGISDWAKEELKFFCQAQSDGQADTAFSLICGLHLSWFPCKSAGPKKESFKLSFCQAQQIQQRYELHIRGQSMMKHRLHLCFPFVESNQMKACKAFIHMESKPRNEGLQGLHPTSNPTSNPSEWRPGRPSYVWFEVEEWRANRPFMMVDLAKESRGMKAYQAFILSSDPSRFDHESAYLRPTLGLRFKATNWPQTENVKLILRPTPAKKNPRRTHILRPTPAQIWPNLRPTPAQLLRCPKHVNVEKVKTKVKTVAFLQCFPRVLAFRRVPPTTQHLATKSSCFKILNSIWTQILRPTPATKLQPLRLRISILWPPFFVFNLHFSPIYRLHFDSESAPFYAHSSSIWA